jgi:hypothetical protein
MKNKSFYFVVVMTKDNGKHKHPQSRTWCFLDSLDEAKRIIEENITDIHECSFNYALIEEFKSNSLPCISKNEWWYYWDTLKDKYVSCDKPEWAEGVCNWGLG